VPETKREKEGGMTKLLEIQFFIQEPPAL
jgi:hypothetical protein